MRTAFSKSSLTGILQFTITSILIFLVIPTFIKVYGAEIYGVFSIVSLVMSFNIFTNMGLNTSLVRFLAEQGKSPESDADIIVTFLILCVITFPLTICGFIFKDSILLSLFNIPLRLIVEANWLFVSMLIVNVFILLGQTFTAILDSQQKMYLTNIYQLIYNFLYWGLIYVVLIFKFSLREVALSMLISTFIWFFLVAVNSIYSWGHISLKEVKYNLYGHIKKQLSYGLKVYTAGVLGFFHEPFTKLLIARFIGITEVGFYDIGLRFKNQISGVFTKLLSPLYPAIAQCNSKVKLDLLVNDIERKIFILILPISAIILLNVKSIIIIMFPLNVTEIFITVTCLVISNLLWSIPVIPIYLYLLAKGYASKTIIVQGLNVAMNTLVFFLFLPWLGYYTIVISAVLTVISTFGLLIYYQKKYLDSYIFQSAIQLLKILITFIGSLFLGYLTVIFIENVIVNIIVSIIIVAVLTIILYRFFAIVNQSDINQYCGSNNLISQILIKIFCVRSIKLNGK